MQQTPATVEWTEVVYGLVGAAGTVGVAGGAVLEAVALIM